MRDTRTCPCGKEFPLTTQHQRQRKVWCSRSCWQRQRRRRQFAQERDCPGCGTTFTLTSRNQHKKWCTVQCYHDHYYRANKPHRKRLQRQRKKTRTDSTGLVVGSDAWAATLLQKMTGRNPNNPRSSRRI